ncbi:hypothetical protein MKZ38_001652 [Zalerion maritima]|uniref:beta-glucosidase n=1 Tax=Zalerion maritima TaxID=339359 RepID=A0AAD5RPW9_9PEZI|nr:hypothetical protein MKZ38_001652 [Zalerion maritima]
MEDYNLTLDPSVKGALPPDFHWGYATAAAQTEGAWDRDGKGESCWDRFGHTPGRIKDQSTCDDATRSYDFYREDVRRMKSYGATAYRFSISWSRVVPLGGKDDPVSRSGVQFYSSLVDELLASGIAPFATLFHWDVPQALDEGYGGMLDRERYVADFSRYARVCFGALGGRVKRWITYNEPGVYALAGFAAGVHAPGRSSLGETGAGGDSGTEPFVVAHTQLLSHAHVARMYREEFRPAQGGSVMVALHGNWSEPWDASDPRDGEAAQRAREFEIAWFADPLYKTGDYPRCMRDQLGDRLPIFTEEEKRLVLGSSDFYGMNSYTSFYVRHRDEAPDVADHKGNVEVFDENKEGVSRGKESDTPWLRTSPWGWAKLLRWIWDRYGVPIYVTENGTTAKGEHDFKPEREGDVLEDPHRVDFFNSYLTEVAKASQEGVVVKSYFAWTFADNWEWAAGYTDRFGVTWVDFESEEKKRYTKRSAYFMKELFDHLIKK